MTIVEAFKALKKGKKVTRNINTYIGIEDGKIVERYRDNDMLICDTLLLKLSANEILNDETGFEIYERPVLDEAEKKYLSAVIRPFKGKVKYIEKVGMYLSCNENYEYILSELGAKDKGVVNTFTLPYFPKGSMYKGMKTGKKYTLEELGL